MPHLSDIVLLTVIVGLLTGCAATPPRPVEVSLDRTELSVTMSDRSRCIGPAPAEATSGWSGRLQGCATPYAYTVTLEDGTNPVRYVLEEVFGALGGEALLAPRATVEIVGSGGRSYIFASPPSEA